MMKKKYVLMWLLCLLALLGGDGLASPTIVGSVNTFYYANAVAVSGNFAYVTCESGTGHGLQIIDVSDPENPAIVGSVNTFYYANAVAVSGNFAYVTCESGTGHGLQIIDV
ncbi:MAG: hypothetical protein GY874_11435, partial [Desulfobacteraceae bacterium]|nr:hypothetical protein [Desulfobacteraceae bacterium]